MSKGTVLITGASSGFGKQTTIKLLERGYTVYAAARRTDRMTDLQKKGALILGMDVTDDASVETGVKQIIAEQGSIDVVYNNAGYGSYGMIEAVPLDEVQRQFEVNVFGVARVARAVLPYMREKRSGRIIITASIVSNISMLGLGYYAATKHAVKAVATALRQEVKGFGVKVIRIEPGTVKTGFDAIALSTLDKTVVPEDYVELKKHFKQYIEDLYSDCPGPESTVQAMVDAGTAGNPRLVYKTTSDSRYLPLMQSMIGDKIADNIILRQMKID